MSLSKNTILKINSKLKYLNFNKSSKKYWNITQKLADKLENIVKQENPLNILEIGTSNGFSTLTIVKSANKNSKILTIEVNKERFLEAKTNFKDCTLKNITQINGEIFDLIENEKINGKFDFIFLDAAQRMYLQLIKKIEKFNLLEKNFTIVVDNVLSHSNMEPFLEYINKNYECFLVEIDSGFLIAKRKN